MKKKAIENVTDVQKLLDYILSIWKPTSGYSLTDKNNFAFFEFISSPKDTPLNKHVTSKVLTEMKASSKSTFSEFSELYIKFKNEINRKSQKEEKFTFYIPIDAEFEKDLSYPISITILENKFQLVNRIPYATKLYSNLPIKLFSYKEELKNYLSSPNLIFLCASAFNKDWNTAWEDIAQSFDVLRGIIEFSFSFRDFRFTNQNKPRAKISHPKWMLIRNQSGSYDSTTFEMQDYKLISKFKFSNKHISCIKNNSRVIRKIPLRNSSKQVLISCMQLYSDSMDGFYRHDQFLRLWNIAESICLANEFGGNSNKVAKRLAWFGNNIGLVSTGYSNIMTSLSKKRNNLVHNGISDINDNDVNHLKFAIDTALYWLYTSLTKLKTISHLSHFYRLRDLPKSELNSTKDTINFLNNL